MRNYVRYIILLVLIIAGGLLIISVVNKFSEPDVSKVDNKKQTEQTLSDDEKVEPSLDVDTNDDNVNDASNSSSTSGNSSDTSTSSTDSGSQTITDNVIVPNTASEQSIVFTVLGLSMVVLGASVVKRNLKMNS